VVGVADGKEVDFVIGQEAVIGVAVEIHTHPHDSYTFWAQAALEIDERRHLLNAGRTPCCPEIQHQNFALEVVKVNFAVGVLDGELGSGGSDVRWTRTAVAAGEEGEGENNGDASHKAIITNSTDGGV
jgi:hypothetical protein